MTRPSWYSTIFGTMTHSLPILSCDGCGACCVGVCSPPGMYAAYASPSWDGVFLRDHEDHDHWQAMPQTLQQELADYYAAQARLPVGERRMGHEPCIWLDQETRRCLHYEHRPTVCREFERGGVHCRQWREIMGTWVQKETV